MGKVSLLRLARTMVRLNVPGIPGLMLALTNAHVVAILTGSTIERTAIPAQKMLASSQAVKQSWTEVNVSRPGAGSWMPTAKA